MIPRKIARPLYAVSRKRQGREHNVFGKKGRKLCVNGAIITLKRRIQFTTLLL